MKGVLTIKELMLGFLLIDFEVKVQSVHIYVPYFLLRRSAEGEVFVFNFFFSFHLGKIILQLNFINWNRQFETFVLSVSVEHCKSVLFLSCASFML